MEVSENFGWPHSNVRRRWVRWWQIVLIGTGALSLVWFLVMCSSIGLSKLIRHSSWYVSMDKTNRPRQFVTGDGEQVEPEEIGLTSREINHALEAAGVRRLYGTKEFIGEYLDHRSGMVAVRMPADLRTYEHQSFWKGFVERNWDAMYGYFQRTGSIIVAVTDGAGGTPGVRGSAVLVAIHALVLLMMLIAARVHLACDVERRVLPTRAGLDDAADTVSDLGNASVGRAADGPEK